MGKSAWEFYVETAQETFINGIYGSVKELNELKEAAQNDINLTEFCRIVLDRDTAFVESVIEADIANENMGGTSVVNQYDRVAIEYRGKPFYLAFYVSEDCDRAFNIYYGRQEFTLGDFKLITAAENIKDSKPSQSIDTVSSDDGTDSPF